LDDRNRRGIPVRGTWDFENAYSLEKILPAYAPDIIERVRERGDENILMGYNNGAMSAMTDDEFAASIALAVTNPRGSGLRDLFGSCEMIIRPQEVMFSPPQVAAYKKAGVKAVCLYYSCISFDAFRTFIPQLPDEQAFNPLTYTYGGESITVIPTYSPNDVMDAGSLRALAKELHKKQESGEIGRDVFIFLNTDADSFLWEPMAVPGPMQSLPCFGGIGGYIDDVADLPYVVFDTPGGYLASHGNAGEITFGQDTADGNLSGYMSWSEKPFNRLIWTRLERARLMASLSPSDRESPSFDTRVRLLSTTHFGLASPVMNITREEKALALSEKMLKEEIAGPGMAAAKAEAEAAGDTEAAAGISEAEARSTGTTCGTEGAVELLNPKGLRLAAVQLSLREGFLTDIRALRLTAEGLAHWTAFEMERYESGSISSIFLIVSFKERRPAYTLHFSAGAAAPEDIGIRTHGSAVSPEDSAGSSGMVRAGALAYDPSSGMLRLDGAPLAHLTSWIRYDGKRVPFDPPAVQNSAAGVTGGVAGAGAQPLALAGEGGGIRLCGGIHLPGETDPGHYTFDILTTPAAQGLVVRCAVQYPYTKEDHEISSQASNLGRFSDPKWTETAPFELLLRTDDTVKVTKRNFAGDISSYEMADFWRAFPENENIASANHQLTGGILSIAGKEGGLLLSHARWVLGSMAHCPLRLRTKDGKRYVGINPFGTYFGPQRYYPSRGNGSSMELYLAAAPQARSLGPSYNGAFEESVQCIYGMPGAEIPEDMRAEAEAFADGMIVRTAGAVITRFDGDNVRLHDPALNHVEEKDLKSVTFVEQCGGIGRVLGMVGRYTANMIRKTLR
ncbi:MAG: hypothetical protein IIY46_00910, partial [Lachnospiraceae bacterium]|nr:hypothetical protein [Lachnospiraceae bacterium]